MSRSNGFLKAVKAAGLEEELEKICGLAQGLYGENGAALVHADLWLTKNLSGPNEKEDKDDCLESVQQR